MMKKNKMRSYEPAYIGVFQYAIALGLVGLMTIILGVTVGPDLVQGFAEINTQLKSVFTDPLTKIVP